MAHDSLLRELDRLRRLSPSGQAPSFAERDADWSVDGWELATRDAVGADVSGWDVRPLAASSGNATGSYEPRPPKVEILEIGPRR